MTTWLDGFGEGANLDRLALAYDWRGQRGEITTPVVVIRHGDGPVAAVTGGVHGDEFEGQYAATRLALQTRQEDVRGTLVICPCLNAPACRAGQRRSPLDDSDLNRRFREDDDPRPSAAFARLAMDSLLPGLDWLLDLHSGGRRHEFLLSSNYQGAIGAPETERDMGPLLAMGAPWALVFDEVSGSDSMPHQGTLEAAARAAGARAFSSELGGGGRLSPASAQTALTAVQGFLAHVGVLRAGSGPAPTSRERLLSLSRPEQTVEADRSGIFAPEAALGQRLSRGDRIGLILDPEQPIEKPGVVRAMSDGVLVSILSEGRVAAHDPVAMVAEPYD